MLRITRVKGGFLFGGKPATFQEMASVVSQALNTIVFSLREGQSVSIRMYVFNNSDQFQKDIENSSKNP